MSEETKEMEELEEADKSTAKIDKHLNLNLKFFKVL